MNEPTLEQVLQELPDPCKRRIHTRSVSKRREPSSITRHDNRDFRCLACGRLVSAQVSISGVRHRNHCPYCLWSRHLDLYEAGDRLAACKASMQPVGLTIIGRKRLYSAANSGELMLVHQCLECGKVSINRLAADDEMEMLWEVFERSQKTEIQLKAQLRKAKIQLLRASDLRLVQTQLVGRVRAGFGVETGVCSPLKPFFETKEGDFSLNMHRK